MIALNNSGSVVVVVVHVRQDSTPGRLYHLPSGGDQVVDVMKVTADLPAKTLYD